MKKKDATYITIGKIGTTYGVHGWLKIYPFTEVSSSILDYRPWFLLDAQGHFEPVKIEDTKIHGINVLVKFINFDSKEAARTLTNKKIAIKRSQLPKLNPGEYYWSDLIGLTVINQSGETLGKVISLIETGSNDVLIVKGKIEQAIPYLPEVIVNIDLYQAEIHVKWEPL